MSGDHTEVEMTSIPDCDIDPSHGEAYADAKTAGGPWGYVCRACFDSLGCELGLGRGQRLVLRQPRPAPPMPNTVAALLADMTRHPTRRLPDEG